MQIQKLVIKNNAVVPIIAALPYAITIDNLQEECTHQYDPLSQSTVYAGGKNYSTCREDESVSKREGLPILGSWVSKSDTKKDD